MGDVNFSVPDLNIKTSYISEIKMSTKSTSSIHSILDIAKEHLRLRVTVSISIKI